MKVTDFDWSEPSNAGVFITIASYGISFNKKAIETLGTPNYVKIGYNRESKVIGVVPVNEKDESNALYVFKGKIKNSYVRISNSEFIANIAADSGIDIEKPKRFNAEWLEDEKLMIVKLK